MPKRKLKELKLTRTIQQTSQGNFIIAIPKRFADMRNVQHKQEVEWTITKDGKLRLEL